MANVGQDGTLAAPQLCSNKGTFMSLARHLTLESVTSCTARVASEVLQENSRAWKGTGASAPGFFLCMGLPVDQI